MISIFNELIRLMEFIKYASFFYFSKHVIASAQHFGRIMRRHNNF